MFKRVLKSKKYYKPSDEKIWLAVYQQPFNYVSEDLLEQFVDKAKLRIKYAIRKLGSKFGFSWSGGKDSNVVCHLLNSFDYEHGLYVAPSRYFEYPSFLDYTERTKPSFIETVKPGYNLEWLRKNPSVLWFDRWLDDHKDKSKKATTCHKWFIKKYNSQHEYFHKHKLSFLVMGRRNLDGNKIAPNPFGINRIKNGFTVLNPIWDWPHEIVLAYIKKHEIELPKCYTIPHGFHFGAVPWPIDNRENMKAMNIDLYNTWKDQINVLIRKSEREYFKCQK